MGKLRKKAGEIKGDRLLFVIKKLHVPFYIKFNGEKNN